MYTGCKGGVGTGRFLRSGIGSGGGHGGKGGSGCYNHTCIEGGDSYGNPDLPCELGSGSGDEESSDSVAGGGIIGKVILHIFYRELIWFALTCFLPIYLLFSFLTNL